MANVAVKTMNVEEFFAWQLDHEDRHELVEGVPVKLMSGRQQFPRYDDR
jgi:hypothetical protein